MTTRSEQAAGACGKHQSSNSLSFYFEVHQTLNAPCLITEPHFTNRQGGHKF